VFQFLFLLRLFRNSLRAGRVYTDAFVKNYVDKDFYVIYILLMFYFVLDMQMYLLCRSIAVYYFTGIDVQNSIIICVRVSSYTGTVHWTQVQFIPAHPHIVAFAW
jgi:hypothetical protein